jgi:ABC-type phosphate transport system substrate-binding protein
MKKMIIIVSLLFAFLVPAAQSEQPDVVLIGNPDVPKLDTDTVAKIYTGKVISVSGVSVKPVNIKSGVAVRNRFLQTFLNQDDEKYIAYWTVRRYIGKGTPPKDLENSAAVIEFVQSTPGGVGYIEAAEVKSGMNVVSSR